MFESSTAIYLVANSQDILGIYCLTRSYSRVKCYRKNFAKTHANKSRPELSDYRIEVVEAAGIEPASNSG